MPVICSSKARAIQRLGQHTYGAGSPWVHVTACYWRSWCWVEPAEDLPTGRLCCFLRCKWTKQSWRQVIKKTNCHFSYICTDSKLWVMTESGSGWSQLALSSFRFVSVQKLVLHHLCETLFSILITSPSCDASCCCLVLTLLYLVQLCMPTQRACNLTAVSFPSSLPLRWCWAPHTLRQSYFPSDSPEGHVSLLISS